MVNGERAALAAEKLAGAGYTNVSTMMGGFEQWQKCDLPTTLDNRDGVSYVSLLTPAKRKKKKIKFGVFKGSESLKSNRAVTPNHDNCFNDSDPLKLFLLHLEDRYVTARPVRRHRQALAADLDRRRPRPTNQRIRIFTDAVGPDGL